jgi:acyl-CoA thioester hydrolase
MEEQEKWFETTVRVRYEETDQMQVVYHANYLVWFEIGRTELIRELGFPYRRFEDIGFMLPVNEVNVKYKSPARYDDELVIRTRVAHCSGVRLTFAYEIYRAFDQAFLVSGETLHVWTDMNLKPVRLEKKAPDLYALIKGHES